jgi:hypothetical protein
MITMTGMVAAGMRIAAGVRIAVAAMPHRALNDGPHDPGATLEGGRGEADDAAKHAHQPRVMNWPMGSMWAMVVGMSIHLN